MEQPFIDKRNGRQPQWRVEVFRYGEYLRPSNGVEEHEILLIYAELLSVGPVSRQDAVDAEPRIRCHALYKTGSISGDLLWPGRVMHRNVMMTRESGIKLIQLPYRSAGSSIVVQEKEAEQAMTSRPQHPSAFPEVMGRIRRKQVREHRSGIGHIEGPICVRKRVILRFETPRRIVETVVHVRYRKMAVRVSRLYPLPSEFDLLRQDVKSFIPARGAQIAEEAQHGSAVRAAELEHRGILPQAAQQRQKNPVFMRPAKEVHDRVVSVDPQFAWRDQFFRLPGEYRVPSWKAEFGETAVGYSIHPPSDPMSSDQSRSFRDVFENAHLRLPQCCPFRSASVALAFFGRIMTPNPFGDSSFSSRNFHFRPFAELQHTLDHH